MKYIHGRIYPKRYSNSIRAYIRMFSPAVFHIEIRGTYECSLFGHYTIKKINPKKTEMCSFRLSC